MQIRLILSEILNTDPHTWYLELEVDGSVLSDYPYWGSREHRRLSSHLDTVGYLEHSLNEEAIVETLENLYTTPEGSIFHTITSLEIADGDNDIESSAKLIHEAAIELMQDYPELLI
jgi:hypothetical protein